MSDRPLFDRIFHFGSDSEDQTISLVLGVNEKEGLPIDLAHGLVGPLCAILAAESLKLMANAEDGMATESVSLHAEAVWLSEIDNHPAIVFELSSGALLPLVIGKGDLAGLASEMAQLAQRPDGLTH